MGPLVKKIIPLIGMLVIVSLVAAPPKKEFNRLNWVEVSQNKLSTQIMFDFNEPVYFNHEVIKEKHQLLLTFPGMNLHSFNPQHIIPKLESLKALGFIQKINIFEDKGAVSKVVLAIEFAPYRETKDQANRIERKKNQFLIKWNTLENPFRLIVDIFLKEDLEQITHKDAVLLHASNDTQRYDVHITSQGPAITQAPNSKPRIMLDPGHGGADSGAKGYFGTLEKDIALDIAKRVHKILRSNGYKTLLTRNDDKDVPLIERAHLAHQLKADLLVSIHVNSSGTRDNNCWGIETFFVNGQDLLRKQKGHTGFLFVNMDRDLSIIKNIDAHIENKMNQSKNLAAYIQKSLMTTLADNNISTNNRGVKQEKFRVFIQTEIPAALVEVGFLTNHKEANRLSKAKYRTILAHGIYNGICQFLAAQ
jgi:N-acetylmuramoyl-L-alanine amidase